MIEKLNEYEEFIKPINEGVKIGKYNSHKNHNPEVDILEGILDKDSMITYGIYIKGPKKGTEFMEYYKGENYVADSKSKSNSRYFSVDKIPSKYKKDWEYLKQQYESKYINEAETINERSTIPKDMIDLKDVEEGYKFQALGFKPVRAYMIDNIDIVVEHEVSILYKKEANIIFKRAKFIYPIDRKTMAFVF